MRFATYLRDAREGLATADESGHFFGRTADDRLYPGDLATMIAGGTGRMAAARDVLLGGEPVDLDAAPLPPLLKPGKIICVGLNYTDHAKEIGLAPPDFPTLFSRYASTLIGHGAPLVRPRASDEFDYEGELAVVVGRRGRDIPPAEALGHVAGYSIFNDATLRDYQSRTSQWLPGKNFDATGGLGPVFVSADELPAGARGLRLETRLNGKLVQNGTTDDLIFDVPALVATISAIMTLEPGDIIITGTPAGVGAGRNPPLWMKPGDVCEIAIEGIGRLRNPVAAA
jgi:acylpyruvate hydrolase